MQIPYQALDLLQWSQCACWQNTGSARQWRLPDIEAASFVAWTRPTNLRLGAVLKAAWQRLVHCHSAGSGRVSWGRHGDISIVTPNNIMTNLYLTRKNAAQAQKADAHLSIIPAIPLLPELVPPTVGFRIGQATNSENFEGGGFDYTPMSVQPGPPRWLQIFRIESQPDGGMGILLILWNLLVVQALE